MTTSTLVPHITWRFSDPASSSANHPDQTTHGWACQALSQGCHAGRSRYLDEHNAHRDADEHERQEALKLFMPGSLVVLIGPAGSGKSRFASTFPGTWVVSLDELRGRLADDAGEQSVTPQAVQLQSILVETRMERQRTAIVDSTNVQASFRSGLVAKAREFDRPTVAIVFLTSIGHCNSRNDRRPPNRRVPHDTVLWQYEQTLAAVPHLADEGLTDIRTVGGHFA
ncbi:ATP-binding protein [Streptomyces aurantiacus]|uniref:Uncharacterized protein n=1 Tax=Streptomyces aurantiacus JA 4570 TaxID=1286094 RepID=S3ZEA9_9ACTN|nr:ATP-binding protein [Streptomyces aurantiacus]EPH41473.1 hypothetical protein STRAU_5477 [Streptomyces aurantiacus JA 4570]